MKMMLKTTAAVAMLAGFASPAFAQATPNGQGSVTIVAPLAITQTNSLEFGGLVPPATGSEIITMPLGSDTPVVPSSVAVVTGGGITAPRRGLFAITGEGNRAITTKVDPELVLKNGTDEIKVTLTNSNPTALASGAASIYIGGSFALAAGKKAGKYDGQYNVEVSYQ